jgi:hypothetical protein
MRDNVEAESPEDYFRKSITIPFLYCTLNEWKQGLPIYTPESLWDYSWFHQLLKILLHSWAPPPPINRVSGSAPVHICVPLWFLK